MGLRGHGGPSFQGSRVKLQSAVLKTCSSNKTRNSSCGHLRADGLRNSVFKCFLAEPGAGSGRNGYEQLRGSF